MSSPPSRRLLSTVVFVLGLALLATACGGTKVVAPTDEPETTSTPPPPELDPDPPTTESPPPTESVELSPSEIVNRVTITAADLPPSYTVEVDDEDDAPCDGRQDVDSIFPADAEHTMSINGDHVFNTVVTVHIDEADAIESFAYNVESLSVCDGALRTTTDGSVRFDIEPTNVQVVGDIDESGSAFYRGTDADLSIEFLMLYARRDNVTVVTFGSETPTTIYLQELMLSRLTGTDPPSRVEPRGEIEVGPGDPSLAPASTEPPLTSTPTEGTPDVALDVRDLADEILEGDPLEFVEDASDAELNELADRTCTKLTGADPDDSSLLDRLFAELWAESDPTVRDQLEPFDFGQLLGVLMGVSCPDTLALLS